MHRRRFLHGLAAGGLALGADLMSPTSPTPTLEELHAAVTQLRGVMATGGQSRHLPALRTYTALLADMLSGTRATHAKRDRASVARVFAEASYLHAFAAENAGEREEHHLAASNVVHGANYADERDLIAVGWIQMAGCKYWQGDHKMAAWAATRAGTFATSGPVAAWAACTEAMAEARRPGSGDYVRVLLDRAEGHITKGDASAWHHTTPGHVRNFRAILATRMGDPTHGEEILRELLLEGFGADTPQRLHTLNDLVETYVGMNQVEAAVETAHELLDLAVKHDSVFQVRRVRTATRPLEVHRGQRDVDELHELLAAMNP